MFSLSRFELKGNRNAKIEHSTSTILVRYADKNSASGNHFTE